MLTMSDQAFGFGKEVTGGGDASPTSVQSSVGLTNALNGLRDSDRPTVIELKAGSYDFSGSGVRQREFAIRAKNLTIRAKNGQRVVLKNLQLKLDLERTDNILIQDLAFSSDGTGPEDAIFLDGTFGSRDSTSRVRITHCSFNGYKDIAIDSHSHETALLATIDRCLFFDANPGQPREPLMQDARGMVRPFVNRGAINIASVVLEKEKRTPGNSVVTIAFNVFVNVWRRCPRVAFEGNFGDIFNNLVFQWGAGNSENNKDNGTATWNGMAVESQAGAVIQANRFIPYVPTPGAGKLDRTIQLGTSNPIVDIGKKSNLPNQFDNGAVKPAGSFQDLSDFRVTLYKNVKLGAPPAVTATDQVPWADIVTAAGPRGTEIVGQASPEKTSRNLVRTALGATIVQ